MISKATFGFLMTIGMLTMRAPDLVGQDQSTAHDEAELALVQQATLLMAEDRWKEAEAAWTAVLDRNDLNVVAYLNRAMSRFRAGDCAGREADAGRAMEVLEEVAVTEPLPELETLVYRAQALGHLQDFDGALALLREAREKYPDSRPIQIVLSLTQQRAEGSFDWRCRDGN